MCIRDRQHVLLRLVEPVDLVDEQHRGPAASQFGLGVLELCPYVLDACRHRAQLDEARTARPRHDGGDRGLADARRSPEEDRHRLSRRQAPQRRAGTQQVLLPDDLFEGRGPESYGQRRAGVGASERPATCGGRRRGELPEQVLGHHCEHMTADRRIVPDGLPCENDLSRRVRRADLYGVTDHRRLLLVHAHPDDESSSTGATIARYCAEGAQVTLVTCTLGEEGEIVPNDLGHLSAGSGLATHRLDELHAAAEALGLSDYVRLGGDGRYHDSGMAHAVDGTATARDETTDTAFWNADLLEAALSLVTIPVSYTHLRAHETVLDL